MVHINEILPGRLFSHDNIPRQELRLLVCVSSERRIIPKGNSIIEFNIITFLLGTGRFVSCNMSPNQDRFHISRVF